MLLPICQQDTKVLFVADVIMSEKGKAKQENLSDTEQTSRCPEDGRTRAAYNT